MTRRDVTPATRKPTAKRRPGRPQAVEKANISRATILRAALKLAASQPLQDISILTVAKTMGVAPTLIHYYVGGRDWLTSGVMNLFYEDLLRKWPAETGNWKDDLLAAAQRIYDQFARYGGIAAYNLSHSRFRVFQLVAVGDRDYGVELLEKFTGRVRASGLAGERTGIYANQFMDFIMSTSHSASHNILPAQHREFLRQRISDADAERYPNIHFAQQGPLSMDSQAAFEHGCNLMLLGMITEGSGRSLSEAVEASYSPPRGRRKRA